MLCSLLLPFSLNKTKVRDLPFYLLDHQTLIDFDPYRTYLWPIILPLIDQRENFPPRFQMNRWVRCFCSGASIGLSCKITLVGFSCKGSSRTKLILLRFASWTCCFPFSIFTRGWSVGRSHSLSNNRGFLCEALWRYPLIFVASHLTDWMGCFFVVSLFCGDQFTSSHDTN